MTIKEKMEQARIYTRINFPSICKAAVESFVKTIITATAVTYATGFICAGLGSKHEEEKCETKTK